MEKRRVTNKVLQGRSRMTTPIFLCLLFSFFLLTSCGNKLKQRFSEEQCIQRLSSLSWDSEDRHKAEAFASNLALPVEQSYNEESMNTDCFLLVERGEGSEDRASAYKNPFKRGLPRQYNETDDSSGLCGECFRPGSGVCCFSFLLHQGERLFHCLFASRRES